jgi:hypothetical protein
MTLQQDSDSSQLQTDLNVKLEDHSNSLLVEYQTCLTDIAQLDSDIWQSGTLFIGLSLAGIALLGQTMVETWFDLATLLGIASISITALSIWTRMIERWSFIIHVDFYRMNEIEMELGHLWMVRYVEHLKSDITSAMAAEQNNHRLKSLGQAFDSSKRSSKISTTRNVNRLVWLMIVGWILLALRALIAFLISQGFLQL